MAAPFISYLTVFRSRLGLTNEILQLAGFQHHSYQGLTLRVRRQLDEKRNVNTSRASNNYIFEYLESKRLISSTRRRTGRYRGYVLQKDEGKWICRDRDSSIREFLPVYVNDMWMAHPSVPSTVGVPTTDNAGEGIDFCVDLGLLAKSKLSWTADAHLQNTLRVSFSSREDDSENPFLLGLESLSLLKQLVQFDGFIIREIVREISNGREMLSRDSISMVFPAIVERAYNSIKDYKSLRAGLPEAKKFLLLIQETARKRERQSSAPGVLEHRVSPRLEWLVDLGYLSKAGLTKNGFQYLVTDQIPGLLSSLDQYVGSPQVGEAVAVEQWWDNSYWDQLRKRTASFTEYPAAILAAYKAIRRHIGPSPIAHVVLIACLLSKSRLTYGDAYGEFMAYAKANSKVRLSGGRFQRTPENVYIEGV